MSKVPSVMSLHLRYRLWIAEMNNDITLLRIFEDYLPELKSRIDKPEVKSEIEGFEKKFVSLRNEIDDLRHDMHLIKMKLAALSREKKEYDSKAYAADNNESLEDRYNTYRKNFDGARSEFMNFEGKWLS